MKTQAGVKTSIHIVVVNKCEMKYMKCHQGVEAAIVPMKNCESRHGKRFSKPVGLIKKRVKRQADGEASADEEYDENQKLIPFKGKKKLATEDDNPANTTTPLDDDDDIYVKPQVTKTTPKYTEDDDMDDIYVKPQVTKTTPNYDSEDISIKPQKDRTTTLNYDSDDISIKPQKDRTTTLNYDSDDISIKPKVTKTLTPNYDSEDISIKPRVTTTPTPNYDSDDISIKPKEDTTTPPNYTEDEDTDEPDMPTKEPYNSDDVPTKKPRGEGSDFDSQMKRFSEEMMKFQEDFMKVFPSADTGSLNKNKQKLHNLSPKDAAVAIEDFQHEVNDFEKDMKSLENDLNDGKPRGPSKLKITENKQDVQVQGAQVAEAYLDSNKDYINDPEEVVDRYQNEYVDGDNGENVESKKETVDEGADDDEGNQHSPENPGLVMPPPGGGAKPMAVKDYAFDYVDYLADKKGGNDKNDTEDILIFSKDATDGDDGKIDGNDKGGDMNKKARDDDDTLPQLKLGDWQDYTGDCPTQCPSRDVMLCARCMHDVYRTFLSTCHLRMFACSQPDEKLQLVSRTPCAASAPFLTDLSASVSRVSEAEDDDAVLRFIYCRFKGLEGGESHPAFKGTNAKCGIAA